MTDTDRSFPGGNGNSQADTVQNNTHELLVSTKKGEDRNNHRFANVTNEMSLVPGAPPWLIYSAPNYKN